MKRFRSLILVIALLICAAMPARAEPLRLASGMAYQVQILNYEIRQYTVGGIASMNLFARIVNNTNQELSVWIEDALIDGTPVVVAPILGIEPHSDSGTEDPKNFYVFAPSESKEEGYEAIAGAWMLDGTLVVKDSTTDDVLLSRSVSIDLQYDVEGTRNLPKEEPPATQETEPSVTTTDTTPAPVGNPTAPAYTPASDHFQTLDQGSRGQAVRDLQQRLTDLGFLNDKVDGVYGENTATAVMSFCTQHGLYIQGAATPEMQQLLYSSYAEYYVKPYIPLIIGPNYKWDNPTSASQDIGWFYVQLVNRDPDNTVRGYELYYYQTDMWGEIIKVPGHDAWLYPLSSQQTIKPGYHVYATPFPVTPFAHTYSVYVGIHKIVFDSGEIREIDPDEVQFFECPIKN